MKNRELQRISTISQFHKLRDLKSSVHPLISVIDFKSMSAPGTKGSFSFFLDLYAIALKRGFKGKMKYGQQEYDFDEGVLSFMAPGQLFYVNREQSAEVTGFLILFHPDLLWNTPLAAEIRKFKYFSYFVNEALFLSENEEFILTGIMNIIKQECNTNIDRFSNKLIVSQLSSFLEYADRYYNRQFITRERSEHVLIDRVENILTEVLNEKQIQKNGLPTVQYLSDRLNVSAAYLSRSLKILTGLTTQQLIHERLIDLAKIKLSTTRLTVGEIASELGFEHSQSFSKLFKSKTSLSPLAFRQSFN